MAAGRIKAGDEINFAVPTGNFGDILAGYYAKMMGLPVHKFICASNSNNVLTDFINTGIYDKRREFKKTISPSMDILVSSNLERLLYSVTDEDSEKVTEWMQQLNTEGVYNVGEKIHKKITSAFFGAWVDEQETAETIRRVYNDSKYLLDPHTAVAWRACEKFSGSVYEAVKNGGEELHSFDALHKLHELTGVPVPEKMLQLENMPILHKEVIEPENMAEAVKNSI